MHQSSIGNAVLVTANTLSMRMICLCGAPSMSGKKKKNSISITHKCTWEALAYAEKKTSATARKKKKLMDLELMGIPLPNTKS